MSRSEGAMAQRLADLKAELAPDLEVIRLLGKGRMAEVYLARQVSLDRLVAVKVLSSGIARDDAARARFGREAKAAASLDSPDAVSVYRYGHLENGIPYLVMQYVKGGTLADRLEAEGPLTEEEARKILAAMAGALASAHERDFVHRDVRAANVLCDRESGRVLLSDFGLAGIRPESQDADARITRTGEIIGTPGYLSPEQLKGETATEATDVFGLGLLGYEILVGQGPFTGRTQRDTIMRSLREPPTPLESLKPGSDPNLARLLERCLAKEPEKRPTAAFLAKAFAGTGEADTHGISNDESMDNNVLESVLKRRLPQIVVVTGVVLYGLLQFVEMLADRSIVSEAVFRIALVTFGSGIAASGVGAWFHGKKGRQTVKPLEVFLYFLIGALWLAMSVAVVVVGER